MYVHWIFFILLNTFRIFNVNPVLISRTIQLKNFRAYTPGTKSGLKQNFF